MRQTGDEDRLQTGKVASDGTVAYTGCLAERIQVGHGELIVQPVEYFTEIIRAGQLGDICRGGKLRHQQAAVFEADIDHGKGRPEMNIVTETLVHPVIGRFVVICNLWSLLSIYIISSKATISSSPST